MDPHVRSALSWSKAYAWGDLVRHLSRWTETEENPFLTQLPGVRSPREVLEALVALRWEWVTSKYPYPFRAYRAKALVQGGVAPLLRLPHHLPLQFLDLGTGWLEACLPPGRWAEPSKEDHLTLLVGPVDYQGETPVLGFRALWAGDPPELPTRVSSFFPTPTVGVARAMGARAVHLLRK